jgi:hypothetical protein
MYTFPLHPVHLIASFETASLNEQGISPESNKLIIRIHEKKNNLNANENLQE